MKIYNVNKSKMTAKKIQKALYEIDIKTKQEKERLIELYIKPINKRLELIKMVRSKEISIEQFIKRTEILSDYLKKSLGQ